MSDETPPKTERLTDAQRRNNHIQSERQRREQVRNGFNQLSEIVPGMEDQGKSEVRVLAATVEYIAEQLKLREEHKKKCMALGMSEGDFEQIYRNEEKAADERHVEKMQSLSGSNDSGSPGERNGNEKYKNEANGHMSPPDSN